VAWDKWKVILLDADTNGSFVLPIQYMAELSINNENTVVHGWPCLHHLLEVLKGLIGIIGIQILDIQPQGYKVFGRPDRLDQKVKILI
jgi:hypothetical protein